MSEPTLVQVFGTNASQTASQLTISKADLATVGLTPSATNTAESLMVALLQLAKAELNSTKQETNTDIQVTIADDATPTIIVRNSTNYRQLSLTVNLETLDTGSAIDPDNY
jgi:hypothetical protein